MKVSESGGTSLSNVRNLSILEFNSHVFVAIKSLGFQANLSDWRSKYLLDLGCAHSGFDFLYDRSSAELGSFLLLVENR
jgi:hypothetical protein